MMCGSHDLRHSYASRALALGENLTMIGRLLGHAKVSTTARYAHLARDSEKMPLRPGWAAASVHISWQTRPALGDSADIG